MLRQDTGFSYGGLNPKDRIIVQQCTDEIKTLMRRTAQDVIEIGQKLAEVKALLGHGQFGAWLATEFEWTDRTAQQFMNVALRFKSENFSDLSFAPSALYLLAAPSTPEEARHKALARARDGDFITYGAARDIVENTRTPKNSDNVLYPPPNPDPLAIHYSSESPEWNTPIEIISRVTQVLGQIDLDPCSNSLEFPNVPAIKHFTQAENGLQRRWAGRVYMNPPYGREIADWVDHLINEYRAERTLEAIALVPARTDTSWFFMLRDFLRCFLRGRLRFSEYNNSAPFPSMLVYLGENPDKFIRAFQDIGDVYQLVSGKGEDK